MTSNIRYKNNVQLNECDKRCMKQLNNRTIKVSWSCLKWSYDFPSLVGTARLLGLHIIVSGSVIVSSRCGRGLTTRDCKSSGRLGQVPSWRQSTSASSSTGVTGMFFARPLMCCMWRIWRMGVRKRREATGRGEEKGILVLRKVKRLLLVVLQ